MKSFKKFLENYDVYIDKPRGWSIESSAVPVDAPNPMPKDTDTEDGDGKEKTEEFPVS
jgi:hypothetical protein